jgi:hypothetical protein
MAKRRGTQPPNSQRVSNGLSLAKAYVQLDRLFYFDPQNVSAVATLCGNVKERLGLTARALKDLEDLAAAGADANELLWLLRGCGGLPGFADTSEVFGFSVSELTKGLVIIEKAASVIEKMERQTFGLLAVHTSHADDGLMKTLRSYVALARAAQRDFGHQSEWFLNIAKARIVIHVSCHANGAVHDREVSGLVAAVTLSDYGPAAHSRWRHQHRELIDDSSLDPYTTMTSVERERRRQTWVQFAHADPEFFEGYRTWSADLTLIDKAKRRSRRFPKPQKRKNRS